MGRLLLFGQRDSLLASMLVSLCPGDTVVSLDHDDPFRALHSDAGAALLLVDLAAGDWQPLALITAVRRRRPACPILVIFPESRRLDAARALVAGADALLPDPFGLEEFQALIPRLLARPATPADLESGSRPATEVAAEALDSPLGEAFSNGGSTTEIADLDALSIFVRGLAHEVNNPLTTIRGFLQLLLHDEHSTGSPEMLEAFQTMEGESRRIAEVIQELEFFSGIRRPSRTVVDLAKLVGDALKSQELKHVEPALHSADLSLLADREQLTIALRHLFGYLASSALESPAQVQVSVESAHGQLVISATGRCSAAASTSPEQLLVPLYAGRTTEPSQRHSLACVFGIARAHGGSLKVGRQGSDRLVFRLSIPVGLATRERAR